jgi:hypothetical protein
MPAITLDTSGGSYSPGYLYWAPLGTAIPGGGTGGTVAGSVFTDAWSAGWVSLGPTLEGTELTTDLNTDTAQVAEFLDPIKVVTTSRTTTMSFSLYNTTLQNYKRVMNGGTISTVSGAGATLLSKFVQVQTGLEVRSMLGFESTQNDERVILYQCLQIGAVTERRRKGTDYNVFPAQFRCEVPASGISMERYVAGTARLGT